MVSRLLGFGLLLVLNLIVSAPAALGNGPKVVVTIKPIHSLAVAVMQNVATPHLLIKGSSSPHGYAMKPSEASALASAELVLWIGPELESFLSNRFDTLAPSAEIMTLLDLPGVKVLSFRGDALWSAGHEYANRDAHSREHEDEVGKAHEEGQTESMGEPAGRRDPHLWLSPVNAVAIAKALAARLSELDPIHAEIYLSNAIALAKELNELDQQWTSNLKPVGSRRFLVFHDAYQYLEAHYGLSGVGSIAVGGEIRPGAARIGKLAAAIRAQHVDCVFAEPQFDDRIIDAILEGSSARRGILDPLGMGVEPGAKAYAQIMSEIVDEALRCLMPRS